MLTLGHMCEQTEQPLVPVVSSPVDSHTLLHRRAGSVSRMLNYSDPSPLSHIHITPSYHQNKSKHLPAFAASPSSPFRSPVAISNSISALKSPARLKHSLARSKRHTARARSPSAFHFTSPSSSGTDRAISKAVSRSSSCRANSNLWSASVVTWMASSLRSVVKLIWC